MSKAIGAAPLSTNTPKVGVAPAVICVCTLGVGGARQAPLPGSVSQRVSVSGSATPPVLPVTVRGPGVPRLKRARLDVSRASAPHGAVLSGPRHAARLSW